MAALHEHAPDLRIDTVLADATAVEDVLTLEQATASWGSRLDVADVSLGGGLPRHDTDKLAAAFRRVFEIEIP